MPQPHDAKPRSAPAHPDDAVQGRVVLVCGGRAYTRRTWLFEVLDGLHAEDPIGLLAHGGATGADSLAADWARDRKVPATAFKADWDGQGRSAGPKRNQRMLEQAQPAVVVAFPGGAGTEDMLRRARKAHVPVMEVDSMDTAPAPPTKPDMTRMTMLVDPCNLDEANYRDPDKVLAEVRRCGRFSAFGMTQPLWDTLAGLEARGVIRQVPGQGYPVILFRAATGDTHP